MVGDGSLNPASRRIASIDALRGFAMLWIIGAGAVFQSLAKVRPTPVTQWPAGQMEHAGWEGFHFMDLIFPLFLFLVGVVIPFTIGRRLEQGVGRRTLYLHIAKRTSVLILLGLINYGLLRFDWAQMRWSSVLGRIGICYCLASLLVIHLNSITIWVGQRFIDFRYSADFLFNGLLQHAGTLRPVLAACAVLFLKWLFLYFLHRHKIYLKA